jgi:hypothetical protein
MTLLFLFPFLLLYGLFFSYELRVSAPAFPLIALVCGFPAERIARVGAFLDRSTIAGIRSGSFLLLCAALLAGVWTYAGQPGKWLLPARLHSALSDPSVAQGVGWFSWALAAAAGFALLSLFCVRIESGRLDLLPAIVIGLLLFVVAGALANPDARLLASQRDLRRRIGLPTVNAKLYAAVRERSIQSGILSNYWYLWDLPELGALLRPVNCSVPCNLAALRAASAAYGDAGYVLMNEAFFAADAKQALQAGSDLTIVFTDSSGMIFAQLGPRPPAAATAPR